jgi:sialic acid synthase
VFDCGVKLVKFQKRDIATEFTKEAFDKPYENRNSFGKTYGEHRLFLELSEDEHKELKEYANSKGLTYFCTPCDIPSVEIMERIGCPFYKVASRDITNIPLLQKLGSLNKPVIISTGMAEMEDIDLALVALNLPSDMVIIMQCTSQYPCPAENCNLNVITTLRSKYNNVIGFSDHSNGVLAPTVATVLGAKIIEKHITLSRSMKGTDQPGSLEFEGLKKVVKYCNMAPIMMGMSEKILQDNVLAAKHKLMKSMTSTKPIKQGTVFTEDMFCLKCPGTGILWKHRESILGKKAIKDIQENITLEKQWFA